MTAKEYLNQAYNIDKEIAFKLRKAEMLRNSLYGKGVSYGSVGHNPNCGLDSLGAAVAKVVDYEKETAGMIENLIAIRLDIESTIMALNDDREREVLEKRYLFFESWEKIAVDMGYSIRMIYYIHNKALKKIHIPE